MFYEALEKLSSNDIRSLAGFGVHPSRVSDWKGKRRLPTRPQALALAHVAGLDFQALDRELTLIELQTEAEKNSGFRTLIPRLVQSAAAL
jgi:hypothetical protein